MPGTYAMAAAFSQAPRGRPSGLAGTWCPVLTGLWHASAAASSGCQALIWPGPSAGRARAPYGARHGRRDGAAPGAVAAWGR